jgi:hypothetical protein
MLLVLFVSFTEHEIVIWSRWPLQRVLQANLNRLFNKLYGFHEFMKLNVNLSFKENSWCIIPPFKNASVHQFQSMSKIAFGGTLTINHT